MIGYLDEKVKKEWEQVKQLQIELEKAEQAKLNKMKYNKISKELVKYCKGENIDVKIEAVKQEIKQMDSQIERKLRKFTSREELFKKSVHIFLCSSLAFAVSFRCSSKAAMRTSRKA